MTNYISLLQDNDLKATIQRTSILKTIDHFGHISIDEIYDNIKEQYPTLSLATIYKNIILMQENNVIIELPLNGKKSKYELKKEEHMHLICETCEKITDTEITSKTKEALVIESFQLQTSQINLFGLCKACQKS